MKKCFPNFLLILALLFHNVYADAQVLVHEEPRHKPVFQDERIRILEVKMPPGDTSQYHIHQTPSVFIFLSNSEVGSQLQGENEVTGKNNAGRILYENLAPPHVRTHRVWNLDKDMFHVMDIELLFKDTGFVLAPLRLPDLELEIDNNYVRAYRRPLMNNQKFSLKKQNRPLILVSLNDFRAVIKQDGETLNRTMKTGEFLTIQKGNSFSLKNTGEFNSEFVLIELPAQ